MPETLEWKEPPPHGGTPARGREIDAVVDQLRQHPGEWAIVVRVGTAGSVKTWQRRGCEARAVRISEDGQAHWDRPRHTIYARWPAEGITHA